MSCKYCQIAEKKRPAHILYHDHHVIAFLVENPVSKGHAIVIPREHVETYTKLSDVAGFARGLQQFLRLMEKRISADMNLIVNHGVKAGQDVPHFSVHVIPRYEGEKIFEWTWYQLTAEEARGVMDKMRR